MEWIRQFGTAQHDYAKAVAIDSANNVIVAGSTSGAIVGESTGEADAFVRAYSPSQEVLWTRQFGTSAEDRANSVTVNSAGTVYVTGETNGTLEGDNAGGTDAFVRAYSPGGDHLWTRQFGTTGSDLGTALAVDATGNVVVAGWTSGALQDGGGGGFDAFLRVYSSNGDLLWTRQFGSSGYDEGNAVAVDDSGNIFITGMTAGLLGEEADSYEAYLRVYSSTGDHIWTRQFGSSGYDEAVALAVDASGNAFVVGWTDSSLEGENAGTWDTYVRAYSQGGEVLWTRQFGTSQSDTGLAVAVDDAGRVIVAGTSEGALQGTSSGESDAFAQAFSPNGDPLWTRQFGTSGDDAANAVAVDTAGNLALAGSTLGDLQGANAGGNDIFVLRIAAKND